MRMAAVTLMLLTEGVRSILSVACKQNQESCGLFSLASWPLHCGESSLLLFQSQEALGLPLVSFFCC